MSNRKLHSWYWPVALILLVLLLIIAFLRNTWFPWTAMSCGVEPQTVIEYVDREVIKEVEVIREVIKEVPVAPAAVAPVVEPPPVITAADTCQTDFNNLLANENVNFESGSAVIAGVSYGLLDQMVAVAANCPAASISVEGHTDSQGDDAMNLNLSDQRAQAVVSYLSSNGVSGNRLSSIGYGETMPIGDNATPDGRAMNRRIEFTVSAN